MLKLQYKRIHSGYREYSREKNSMPNIRLPLSCATYTKKEPYIFISYSHADGDQVYPELEMLYERGYRIWYDDNIELGSDWREGIARAITDSAMFMVFISRNSIQSRNVIKEINFAVDENKHFLAVHLEEVSLPPGLRLSIGDVQAVMKWRMPIEDYWRKMMKVLPGDCLEKREDTVARGAVINDSHQGKPAPDEVLIHSNKPDRASQSMIKMKEFVIRDLTPDFLPEKPLKFPVKVFHGKIQPDDAIREGSIVFILNPVRLCQLELKLLLQYKACFVLFKDSAAARIPMEQHPVQLLLDDNNANRHLERIKDLHKHVLELHIERNKRWDFLGIMSSCRPLFSIKNLDFCFKEFPIINEEALTLDDVFIQEAAKPAKPVEIIRMYLEIIENHAASKLEATNRRNALQKVFRFYKSREDDFIFQLNVEDLSFLVDMLRLEEKDKLERKAIVIGALTAACSYFVHMGHPMGFQIIMEKLLLPGENSNIIKYKHIPDADLNHLKSENPFLYYHLTCRIPNQYTVALFDMFLIETDPLLRRKYEATITDCLQYLKRQIKELSLMPEVLLWEFKRDQEIGAIAGTIGQITLYMQADMNGEYHAFDEAEKFLKVAVEYAHPAEKNRDENYLIQCGLARIVQDDSLEKKGPEAARELKNLALILGQRFLNSDTFAPFDVMFSASIVAVSNIVVSSELAEDLYVQMGFQWEHIGRIMNEASHPYPVFLLVSYLFFAPGKLIESIPDFEILVQKALAFFQLNDAAHRPGNMIDLIALKFILAHAWYLSIRRAENDLKTLENYKLRIEHSPIYAKWAFECVAFLNDCLSQTGSPFQALRLIYAIPY
jgi:hypothetical protein